MLRHLFVKVRNIEFQEECAGEEPIYRTGPIHGIGLVLKTGPISVATGCRVFVRGVKVKKIGDFREDEIVPGPETRNVSISLPIPFFLENPSADSSKLRAKERHGDERVSGIVLAHVEVILGQTRRF